VKRYSVTLRDAHQGYEAIVGLWKAVKMNSCYPVTVTAEAETRNGEQNKLLHALLGEIATKVEWAGAKRDLETWKRLLVASWLRARGESIEVLPALDGHGIDVVFRHTSKLTKAECAELIEFVQAWAAEHGVGCETVA
jgi:hypothetical protein